MKYVEASGKSEPYRHMYHICAAQYPAMRERERERAVLWSACQQPCFFMRRWSMIIWGLRGSTERAPVISSSVLWWKEQVFVCCYFSNATNALGKMIRWRFRQSPRSISSLWLRWLIAGSAGAQSASCFSWQLVDHEQSHAERSPITPLLVWCRGMLLDMNTIVFF